MTDYPPKPKSWASGQRQRKNELRIQLHARHNINKWDTAPNASTSALEQVLAILDADQEQK